MSGAPDDRPEATSDEAREDASGEAGRTVLREERLLESFDEGRLARLLRLLFSHTELRKLMRSLHARPTPGKRPQSMSADEHARSIAERALRDRRSRLALLERVHERLGGGDPPPPYLCEVPAATIDDVLDLIGKLPGVDRARLLLVWLERDDLRDRIVEAFDDEKVVRPLDADEERRRRESDRRVREAERRARRAEERAERLAEERERGRRRLEDLERRLADERRASDDLRRRLGESHEETERLKQLYEEAKGDAAKERRRATDLKRELKNTRAPAERERELEQQVERLRRELAIEQQKVELLEWELDQLQYQDEVADEAAPVAAPPRDPLAERSREAARRRGRRLRVLVLGGAGKQRRHLEERFPALMEQLALEGEWRLADYRSWHRDLPKLQRDLRERFDLVFVLHWNRTTFVRRMQEMGRKADVEVRTVRYDGFLSLERAIREELERFLDREED